MSADDPPLRAQAVGPVIRLVTAVVFRAVCQVTDAAPAAWARSKAAPVCVSKMAVFQQGDFILAKNRKACGSDGIGRSPIARESSIRRGGGLPAHKMREHL